MPSPTQSLSVSGHPANIPAGTRPLIDAARKVVTLGTLTKHASLFFARGVELQNDDGLLEGAGKSLRYVTLRTPSDARGPELEKLLREAVTLATSPKPRQR